ncbi:4'-phosphopantetheinyl transferase family protein [Photobacterium leiognathi]|uniref:4'-phosphopantetheinyl transferase family protein n=1 Tax=Photobacterium leiognathi TaxID=553611 RepID=UPI0027391707|nr:4'-phosphopantetheinyl transferase superfamily protein [Photobacterium leiognathi]
MITEKNHIMTQYSRPNITLALSRVSTTFEAQLPSLWLPTPHQQAYCISATISLMALNKVLNAISLDQVFPSFLAGATRQRQLTFIGGRLCAEHAAAKFNQPNPFIFRSPDGVPIWPVGLRGSITHTENTAYAITSQSSIYKGLGIDSEWVVGDEGVNSILSMCCTKQELSSWFKYGLHPLIATIIFSAKEAAYKAIHNIVMRYVDFTEFEVSELYLNKGWLILSPVAGSKLINIIRPLKVYFQIEDGERACVHTVVAVSGNEY